MSRKISWLRGPKLRYLIVGISVYLFELLVIVIAQQLGASDVLAVGISFWAGLLVSFAMQKLVTFGDTRTHYKIIVPQIIAFSILVLFNFGFTILVTKLLSPVMPAVWCRTIALAITTIWNFYLYRRRIFTQTTPPIKKIQQKQRTAFKFINKRMKRLAKWYKKWRATPRVKRLHKFASRKSLGKWYLLGSLAILFTTTMLWSLLGAQLQQLNADQLVNAHLFANHATIHGAAFPDQHSFLIKWPLFYIVMIFGYSTASFLAVTVLTVLLTVALFVYILSRIERRPLVLGSLCLLLSSVLLLVPAQPYAGGLLPVNMAMLTTRNLEYVVYIASLMWLIKAPRVWSKQFGGAILLLGLLVASDRLFFSIGLLGAVLAMVCYSLRRRWELVSLSSNWILLSISGGLSALLAVAVINWSRFTHIIASPNLNGPYGLVDSIKDFGIGVMYAAGGLLTNFGANPGFDALTLRQIPNRAVHHLLSFAGLAYILNGLLLLFCLILAANLLARSFNPSKKKSIALQPIHRLGLLLVWSGLASIVLFVATNHYYQVDARYLTICMFGLFVVLAAWLRPKRLDSELVALLTPLFLLSIVCGVIGSIQTHNTQQQALAGTKTRDSVVARTLANHHVSLLIGDYWRVLPIKQASHSHRQPVLPLEQCNQPRKVLNSADWQPRLEHRSFAYLLTFDGSLTDYPKCSLKQIVEAYGLPDSTALVAGSLAKPKEMLLFYDRGIHPSLVAPSAAQTSATILPTALNDLMHTNCPVPTIMNIVAHQDDDLLFMNPDLLHDITEGHCIRSVYLTAGDAGADQPYWLSREQGSEAAYSEMAGSHAVWIQRVVQLPGGQFITVASPKDNDRISLIFMHLPDGNLGGEGFGASRHESLAELEASGTSQLQTVDHQSTYNQDQLVSGIADLFHTYRPTIIRTQSNYSGDQYPDHSDHLATGRFAARAYQQYETQQYGGSITVPLSFYIGYPIHQSPPNLSDEDMAAKLAAFSAYARYDGGVCHSHEDCQQSSTYGSYLTRQYQNPY